MEYELKIVKGKSRSDTAEKVEPVIGISELLRMQERVREIFIHDALYRYIGELVQATRNHPMAELGVKPQRNDRSGADGAGIGVSSGKILRGSRGCD